MTGQADDNYLWDLFSRALGSGSCQPLTLNEQLLVGGALTAFLLWAVFVVVLLVLLCCPNTNSREGWKDWEPAVVKQQLKVK